MADRTRIEHAPGGGGRIEVWRRDLFGVSLLPDEGKPGYPGVTFTSTQDPEGFPHEYDEDALLEWARERWPEAFRP